MNRDDTLQARVDEHLDAILSMLAPGCKATIVVRNPHSGSSFLIHTTDELPEVARLIDREIMLEKTVG
nr:hypothetical protein [Brucella anthropi]DAM62871.1 MAG TPA: hypothetical protein [Caudoviricetes sp.]